MHLHCSLGRGEKRTLVVVAVGGSRCDAVTAITSRLLWADSQSNSCDLMKLRIFNAITLFPVRRVNSVFLFCTTTTITSYFMSFPEKPQWLPPESLKYTINAVFVGRYILRWSSINSWASVISNPLTSRLSRHPCPSSSNNSSYKFTIFTLCLHNIVH